MILLPNEFILQKRPYISIVIPTCGRAELLKRCLKSALNQDMERNRFEYEIIIVLDKSDRETEKWLSQQGGWSNKLKFVRASHPGVNAARNTGIKNAKGEVIFFLDDDCVLPGKDWIGSVYRSFKEYREASVIGGGYTISGEDDIFALSRNKLDNFYVESNRKSEYETAALLGGNSGYRREIFKKCGVFDERIRYGSAETEMNDRIIKYGKKMYFINELSVIHLPKKQKLLSYLVKSFKQGRGKIYSCIKNGIVKSSFIQTKNRMNFLEIVRHFPDKEGKLIAKVFLFLNSLFYWVGIISGFIWYSLEKIVFKKPK